MRTRIVRIGNSRGVRIPKALLEDSGLSGDVDISLQDGAIVINAASRPRQGWEDALRRMALLGDDELLDGEVATSEAFDEESWEWE